MRNSITNCDIETNDLAWIQKMVAGPENIDGLDWVDEDELTGEEITDIRQLEAFGVTDRLTDRRQPDFLEGAQFAV